jgi:uncharacterized membrane protein YdbT with pleckstrin-like domain
MSTPDTPSDETILWRGRPSQWTNFGWYFFCLLLVAGDIAAYVLLERNPLILAGLALPVLLALPTWVKTRSHVYELTNQRLREACGVLSRRTTDLELYRVRDYTVVEPLWLRLIGCGHLVIDTADRSSPQVTIRAVHGVSELKELVRTHTERMRQARGVRDFEINPQ